MDEDVEVLDWVNLPHGVETKYLWGPLHDAEIVSIRSDLLNRKVLLHCDIDHLRAFHGLPEGFQLVLGLEGVHSARVHRYAIWPGEFSVPPGVTREEESRLIKEYQDKWREESLSWEEFENAVTRDCEQIFDIKDAAIATSKELVALKLCGHLNYDTYHEVFLRAEKITISGSNGRVFGIEEFQDFGQAYWDAFGRR